jgi:hypothetical protein
MFGLFSFYSRFNRPLSTDFNNLKNRRFIVADEKQKSLESRVEAANITILFLVPEVVVLCCFLLGGCGGGY